MKFATLVALIATTNATRIMSRDAVPSETAPAETALASETPTGDETTPAEEGSMDDHEMKSYQYPIEDQNFNGILGMLGTPTSMTSQLHTMFNQIHFNERVMRQIRKIVNDTPELVETLCAEADGEGDKGSCECPVGNNILYGAITDEGKIDYMLGFAQDIAGSESTKCSNDVFGDPVPDAEKYCWCQQWESNDVVGTGNSTAAAQTFSSHDITALAQML